MKAWMIAIGAALLAAACTPEAQDEIARETAKGVVNPILAARFPGVPIQPISDCVIDNATTPEIIVLADGALNGVTATTQSTVTTILQRPGTIDCIARTGLPSILAGL